MGHTVRLLLCVIVLIRQVAHVLSLADAMLLGGNDEMGRYVYPQAAALLLL